MIINPTVLTEVYRSMNAAYRKGFLGDSPAPVWNQFATEIPSTTREEIYPWLKSIPGMREWLGQRVKNNLSGAQYRLKNRKWENTIEVSREDIEDDRIGLYAPIAEQLGVEARVHLDVFMAQVVEAGTTTTCWDGQFFFDTDHPQDADNPGGTTYTNYYATAGTEGNHALSESTLGKLWQKGAEFKKENGEPIGITFDTIMVPPALSITARRILNSTFVASANPAGGGSAGVVQSNTLHGLVDVIDNPYLTSTTAWYLMVTKRPLKPFILQMHTRADKLTRRDRDEDDNVFNEDVYAYGVRGRYAGGYSFPQLCIKADT